MRHWSSLTAGMEKIMTYKFEIRTDKKITHPNFIKFICHKYEEDYTCIARAANKQEAITIVKSLGINPVKIERHAPDVPRMINLNYAAGEALKNHKEKIENQISVRISYSDVILRLMDRHIT